MELITGAQAREMDRAAMAEGTSSLTLMERAAAGLADAVMDLAPERAGEGREKELLLPTARNEVVTGGGTFPYERSGPGGPERAMTKVRAQANC